MVGINKNQYVCIEKEETTETGSVASNRCQVPHARFSVYPSQVTVCDNANMDAKNKHTNMHYKGVSF